MLSTPPGRCYSLCRWLRWEQSAVLDTLPAQRVLGRLFKSPCGMQAPAGRRKRKCDLQLSLFVRWHSPAGKTKVTRLQLRSVGSVDCLQVWRPLSAVNYNSLCAVLLSSNLLLQAPPGTKWWWSL